MKKLLVFLETIKYFGLRKVYYNVLGASKQTRVFLNDIKTYKRRNQPFINEEISRILIEHFDGDEGQNVLQHKHFIGYALIHYAFIRNSRPKNILCIGSRKGFIPAILALACKDNAYGHVDFVDAGYDRDNTSKHWSGVGFWKKNDPVKHFARVDVSKFITTHVMTTTVFAKNHPDNHYQYVYIDGDHSYKGVKHDHRLFWPQLDPGGFMLFHDIVAHGYLDKGLFGVWKFWNGLKEKSKIIFPFPNDSGLGIIQKQR